MIATIALIAQQADTGPKPPPDMGPFGNPMFMMTALGLMFVFLFILPARTRKKEEEAIRQALKPGVKVTLSSGIVGSVVKLHDTEGELTIRSDDAKFRVLKSAVIAVRGEDKEAVETK